MADTIKKIQYTAILINKMLQILKIALHDIYLEYTQNMYIHIYLIYNTHTGVPVYNPYDASPNFITDPLHQLI